MKKLILLAVIVLSGLVVMAQNTFFPTREGTVLVYKTYDKKKNLLGITRYTIQKVDKKGSDLDINYLIETMDAQEKPVYSDVQTVRQKGDTVYFDLSNFIDMASLHQDILGADSMVVVGNVIEVPLEPKVGDDLPDANVQMALQGDSAGVKTGSQVTNRKVLTVEDVTVTAGTYTAYKLSSDINSTKQGVATKSRNTVWVVKGIGTIKSENYDKSGKLQTRTELAELVSE